MARYQGPHWEERRRFRKGCALGLLGFEDHPAKAGRTAPVVGQTKSERSAAMVWFISSLQKRFAKGAEHLAYVVPDCGTRRKWVRPW